MLTSKDKFLRRSQRVRYNLKKNSGGKCRLSVFKSDKHIYAQIIDDSSSSTLAAVSSLDKAFKELYKKGSDIEAAKVLGKLIAERALAKDIKEVVFDRSGFRYHGRIMAMAEAARAAGLSF